ncbi:MAG: xanthine dehydrogenase family protein molybdopterin-binding subunit [Euzebya sp.]
MGPSATRVDGQVKVSGAATYTTDVVLPQQVHAVVVQATVATGRIRHIELAASLAAPGVLGVLTHHNTPALEEVATFPQGPAGQRMAPLQSDVVYFDGQPVAVVIAETRLQAVHAAELVQVDIQPGSHAPSLWTDRPGAAPLSIFGESPDSVRGNPDAALAAAEVRLERRYSTPTEHHHPLEPGATVACWDGDSLTVYDSTQWIFGVREALCVTLGLSQDRVRVQSPFVGGAFGSKGMVWPHVVLTVLAARHVGRPVKLTLDRGQMFTLLGYRSPTIQRLSLGATASGTLTALVHDTTQQTSMFQEFAAGVGFMSRSLYVCPNVAVRHRVLPINAPTPTVMRAPGEAVGSFALETAMDELAVTLSVDPIQLRLRNHAEIDPHSGMPWSSNALRECYLLGADRFGWDARSAAPGSMRDGHLQLGWGVASATYAVNSEPANAWVRLRADGTATVACGTQDLGTGTYTTMAQIAAEALGLPVDHVSAELGDTELPRAPHSGGSQTAASVLPAVWSAAQSVIAQLNSLAQMSAARESPNAILRRHGLAQIEGRSSTPSPGAANRFAMQSFGAQFAEVAVDPDLAQVRVTRFVGVFGAGRIVNQTTARSQMIGGIVGGIGMALLERTVTDPRSGRVVSPNLSAYLVPTQADIPAIDVSFVEEVDPHVNSLGIKGVAELGIVGVAAAIGNAIFHATGRRIRDLPITCDTLLGATHG